MLKKYAPYMDLFDFIIGFSLILLVTSTYFLNWLTVSVAIALATAAEYSLRYIEGDTEKTGFQP
jgi:hypothetical protein